MEKPLVLENNEFYEKEKYFSQFGSVLNLCQFFFSDISESYYDFSRFVAKETLKTLQNRNAEFYKKIDEKHQSKLYLNLGFYGTEKRKKIEKIEPTGKKINLNEFLGKSYSLKFKEITHFSNNDYGLSYALLNPPYGLNYNEFIRQEAREFGGKKLKNWEQIRPVQTKLFNHFLDKIGIDFKNEEKLIIYKWSNDWAEYFDAGKEWWGTFFWTILDKEKGEITVISASSTD